MANHDIIVIGASAGGVEALKELVRMLPAQLPAAIFVVLHVSPTIDSNLGTILSRAGTIPAVNAENDKPFQHGRIYVAVADFHLLLENDRMVLVRGPRENRHRPAIDPLFRSAALAHGPRVIGVVLSGVLDDGSIGLWQIERRGGLAVVQDPKDARFADMPRNALDNVDVDYCEPLERLGPLLVRLVKSKAPAMPKHNASQCHEPRFVKMEDTIQDICKLRTPSAYVCPECAGIEANQMPPTATK
jgi:two-component system chemotaxis response regulator CheB